MIVCPIVIKAGSSPPEGWNGGEHQVGLNFLQIGGDYAFINHLKSAQAWARVDNSAVADPNILNAQGYPTSITFGGVYTVFYVPLERTGNWIVKWTGNGTILLGSGHSLVSGSLSGSNGRAVISVSQARVVFQITAVTTPFTECAFMHADDEAAYDAGSLFTPLFIQRLRAAKFGVIRFLDWHNSNTSNVSKWAHRTALDYVHYTSQYKASVYGGVTTNVGAAYSVAAPADWTGLADKALVMLKFNASDTTDAATLNVGGTGAKAIRNQYGNVTSSGANDRPVTGKLATLVFDADLDCWIKHGGDTDPGDTGIRSGVPIEACIQLCREVGAHPWFLTPYLAADPVSDYMTELATYCRDHCPTWMIPRFEITNETWNSAVGFSATRYAWNKALDHWPVGGSFNHHNWVGKVASAVGQAISAVYGDNRSRYHMIVGVQSATYGLTSDSNPRLASTDYVAIDAGDPASDWVTHVCQANYWNAQYPNNVVSDAEELRLAFEYDSASAARRLEIITDYVDGSGSLAAQTAAWASWASGFGCELNCYEGGWSPDYPSADSTGAITGASKAASCVLTMVSNGASIGQSLTISGIVGMTELNGNTYTVTNVVGNAVTINVNSLGFTTYSSGGTATYVDSQDQRNVLRRASKAAPNLYAETMINYNSIVDNGGTFPSWFLLAALVDSQVWSLFSGPEGASEGEPSGFYVDPSTAWQAVVDWGHGNR